MGFPLLGQKRQLLQLPFAHISGGMRFGTLLHHRIDDVDAGGVGQGCDFSDGIDIADRLGWVSRSDRLQNHSPIPCHFTLVKWLMAAFKGLFGHEGVAPVQRQKKTRLVLHE